MTAIFAPWLIVQSAIGQTIANFGLYPEPTGNRIEFSATGQSAVSYYEIWRAPNDNGPFTRVATVPVRAGASARYAVVDGRIEAGLEYWYYVSSVTSDRVSTDHTDVMASIFAWSPAPPTDYALNARNSPFGQVSSISVSLEIPGHLWLGLCDLNGKTIAVLADEMRQSGEHRFTLATAGLREGVYILHADAGVFHSSLKLLVMNSQTVRRTH